MLPVHESKHVAMVKIKAGCAEEVDSVFVCCKTTTTSFTPLVH